MEFRMAAMEDFEAVMQFYYDLIDDMQGEEFHPDWEKDVYPARDFIQSSTENNELIITLLDNAIVGAMVLNHSHADGYDRVKWGVETSQETVAVIHALGISLHHQGKGIAKKMLAFAMETCRENGVKAIRLDVLASNIPAQNLYTKIGFIYRDTIQLYYEDTGLADFLLYELAL